MPPGTTTAGSSRTVSAAPFPWMAMLLIVERSKDWVTAPGPVPSVTSSWFGLPRSRATVNVWAGPGSPLIWSVTAGAARAAAADQQDVRAADALGQDDGAEPLGGSTQAGQLEPVLAGVDGGEDLRVIDGVGDRPVRGVQHDAPDLPRPLDPPDAREARGGA